MKMNRRNALLGLGTIATGGGALFGSGAFSQVEADRSVSVTLANDASALLQLDPVNTTVASTTNGTIELDFAGAAAADGINYDAVTEFTSVFTITNNGDSSVDVYLNQGAAAPAELSVDTTNHRFYYDVNVDSTLQTGSEPIFEFYGGNSVPGTVDGSNGIVGSGSAGNLTLASGASSDVSVRLDTTGVDSSVVTAGNELIGEVTINAV